MALNPRIGVAAAVVTVSVWTAFIVIARASASHSLAPLDIAWLRILGASAVLLPWALWRTRQARLAGQGQSGSLWGLSPLPLRLTMLTGTFGGVLYALLAYSGFFFAPAAHASVLLPGSLPLWTSVLAVWVLGERLPRARLFGLVCIVLGDLLVGGASLLQAFDGSDVWKGDVLFVLAAFCWSVYSVLVRRHQLDPVQTTMAITAFAFVAYVPAYAVLVVGGALSSGLAAAPWQEMLFQALFQGVGSVVVSGISFTLMIRHFGPVRSTMITALVPGLSAMGAVWLLAEPMSINLVFGLLMVTAGIVLGVRSSPATIATDQAAKGA